MITILGDAEHSGASLSETLSDVPGQHSTQGRAKMQLQCSANERCEICPGPGHFGDVHVNTTLAYAWDTYLYHASIFRAVKFMYMYINRSLYFSKGTTFFICVSRPAHALISASGEKKNTKNSKKMRPSGQVRVDKYCPRQAQRKRQIAQRKQQYYGD